MWSKDLPTKSGYYLARAINPYTRKPASSGAARVWWDAARRRYRFCDVGWWSEDVAAVEWSMDERDMEDTDG